MISAGDPVRVRLVTTRQLTTHPPRSSGRAD
jgi:hypothetical protein